MNDMDDKLIQMARLFHDTYEALASSFGYTTRDDTKAFDPESPNGKLMCAVVGKFKSAILADAAKDVEPVAFMFQHSETGRITFVDAWQKENGWSAGNPRFFEVGALVPASTLAAAQAINAELVALLQEAGRTIDNLTACAGRSGQSIQVRAAIFTKSGT